jgi:hypothetical protein
MAFKMNGSEFYGKSPLKHKQGGTEMHPGYANPSHAGTKVKLPKIKVKLPKIKIPKFKVRLRGGVRPGKVPF